MAEKTTTAEANAPAIISGGDPARDGLLQVPAAEEEDQDTPASGKAGMSQASVEGS